MGFYESALRPLLFRLDAEWVHEAALGLIARGVVRGERLEDPSLEQTLFGVKFPNPLGLAAGFDKNAVAVEVWEELGFGFAEVGTVTPLPQPGNPRPRLFRLPEERALINRMGFNSDGAKSVANRLRESRPSIPIGVNIGKNADTPIERAAADYAKCFRELRGLAAYYAINVSSPNSPGLRELQDKDRLREIVLAIRELDAACPLLVKVSPDLEPAGLDDVVEVAREGRLTGIIATNTTTRRDLLAKDPEEEGGLSGRPLKPLADAALAHLAKACGKEMVLISSGGIFDGDDLLDKLALGAHLCQVYTGWVYGGPGMVGRALRGLAGRQWRHKGSIRPKG